MYLSAVLNCAANKNQKMALRFMFFESTRLNFLVYFSATTLVLLIGPEWFIPGLKKNKESPLIEAPCGQLIGTMMNSRKGRILDSYRGKIYHTRSPGYSVSIKEICIQGEVDVNNCVQGG